MFSSPAVQYQKPGSQAYTNVSTAAGDTTILSGAANTTGIIVRTAFISGATSAQSLRSGIGYLLVCAQNNFVVYSGPGFLIPAGQPLVMNSSLAGNGIFVTWDIV